MNEAHQRLEDLLPAYALGALEGREWVHLSVHLAAGCLACTRELALLNRDLELLAAESPPVEPAPEVWRRILSSLRETPLLS